MVFFLVEEAFKRNIEYIILRRMVPSTVYSKLYVLWVCMFVTYRAMEINRNELFKRLKINYREHGYDHFLGIMDNCYPGEIF